MNTSFFGCGCCVISSESGRIKGVHLCQEHAEDPKFTRLMKEVVKAVLEDNEDMVMIKEAE